MSRIESRDEDPWAGIGRSEITPLVARLLALAALLALLAVPLAGGIGGDAGGAFGRFARSLPGRPDPAISPAAGWLAANRSLLARMDDFERGLEDGSVLRRALPAAQRLLSGWGGVGNEKVYLGRDGWLFYRPGVDYLTGPGFLAPAVLERRRRSGPGWQDAPQPDPRRAILDFHRQLADRGVSLLVMPVPTKAMIYPDALVPGLPVDALAARVALASLQNPSFDRFRGDLEHRGIEFFDPAASLIGGRQAGEEVFLRTDSHWSPAGLDAVARDLAARLRQLGFGEVRRPVERHPPGRRPVVVRGRGDLAKMLDPPDGKIVPREDIQLQRLMSAARGKAEILLLGDSYSNVFSQEGLGWGTGAGLAEQLGFYLGAPVERLAINDGGPWGLRRRLTDDLASGRDRLAGKRLVIYQFAVRELAIGDWKLVRLSPSATGPGSARVPRNEFRGYRRASLRDAE